MCSRIIFSRQRHFKCNFLLEYTISESLRQKRELLHKRHTNTATFLHIQRCVYGTSVVARTIPIPTPCLSSGSSRYLSALRCLLCSLPTVFSYVIDSVCSDLNQSCSLHCCLWLRQSIPHVWRPSIRYEANSVCLFELTSIVSGLCLDTVGVVVNWRPLTDGSTRWFIWWFSLVRISYL